MDNKVNDIPQNNDIYEPVHFLGDYVSALAAIQLTENGLLKLKDIQTVEERYQNHVQKRETGYLRNPELRQKNEKSDKEFDERMGEIIESNPEKIKRINDVVAILNTNTDPVVYKQGVNEILRLIRGKDTVLTYTEPEFSPDLLVV